MPHGGSGSRLSPQREVEEQEEGPGGRGDEAAVTEVPQRDTGHGGRASIALHHSPAKRELYNSVCVCTDPTAATHLLSAGL